jgi:hypothetical protein
MRTGCLKPLLGLLGVPLQCVSYQQSRGDALLSQDPRLDGSCTVHATDRSEERQHDLEYILEGV